MWGHLAANVRTSKQVGGDRVSTISLPGCSTYVALATGPNDEEEPFDLLPSTEGINKNCLFNL